MVKHKTFFKSLPHNSTGRDFIVSDIHGHIDDLNTMLAGLNFDPVVDRVLFAGDAIDRGPNSWESLLIYNQQSVEGVIGNHELLLIDSELYNDSQAFHTRRYAGGTWTDGVSPSDLRAQCQFLVDHVPYVLRVGDSPETGYVVVHGELWYTPQLYPIVKSMAVVPSWDHLNDQFVQIHANTIVWSRKIVNAALTDSPRFDRIPQPCGQSYPIFCGHTPIGFRSNTVQTAANHFYIDGGCGEPSSATMCIVEPNANTVHLMAIEPPGSIITHHNQDFRSQLVP